MTSWVLGELLQLADAFGRAHHIGEADAELLVHHDDLAMRDQRAVDEHIQRFAGGTLQLDHRTLVQLQQAADGQARAAHFQRQRDRHVQDHVEVDVLGGLFGNGCIGSHDGSYCITKLVKYTFSRPSGLPPSSLMILRTLSSAARRRASLPSCEDTSSTRLLPSNSSRSLRMMGLLCSRNSAMCSSRVISCTVTCRKRALEPGSKFTTKGSSST